MTPCEYFAKRFHKCLAGPGTKDERLMQLVVNHCEVITINTKSIGLAILEGTLHYMQTAMA